MTRAGGRYCAVAVVVAFGGPFSKDASAGTWVASDITRGASGARASYVLVAQTELLPHDTSRFDGALVEAIQSAGARRSAETMAPLRAELEDFDVDELIRRASMGALARIAWLNATSPELGKDATEEAKLSLLDSAATDEVVILEFRYDMLHDLSGVRVTSNLRIAPRAIPEGRQPRARLADRYAAFRTSIIALVELPDPSKEPEENLLRWVADDGRLAREALTVAIDDVRDLIPRAFDLTSAEAERLRENRRKTEDVGSASMSWVYRGRPVADVTDRVLFVGTFHLGTTPIVESWLSARTLSVQ